MAETSNGHVVIYLHGETATSTSQSLRLAIYLIWALSPSENAAASLHVTPFNFHSSKPASVDGANNLPSSACNYYGPPQRRKESKRWSCRRGNHRRRDEGSNMVSVGCAPRVTIAPVVLSAPLRSAQR
ncbi:hypothetical protein PIB30_023670 [Stylosanthes scabra]|uniref:Uncharacterized protein n=1 Tax=Stylosanthes scabra TaxID=79078 RepID=A0ABU6SB05_9FABA|nr:hypothetical protein [Stylosanthes scabra]